MRLCGVNLRAVLAAAKIWGGLVENVWIVPSRLGWGGRVLVFLGCLWTMILPTLAQEALRNGNLQGTVVDTTGAAIGAARVTLRDKAGNVTANTTTNPEGHFTISGVVPGSYVLEVEGKNFDKSSRDVLVSPAAGSTPLLITLNVASLQQSIDVSAAGVYALPDAVGRSLSQWQCRESRHRPNGLPSRQASEDASM